MHPILRNLLALLAGLFIGGSLNMAVIVVGGMLFPPPEGVDVNDLASINAHIGDYSVLQLMVPLLAHALGTFIGALIVARFAASWQMPLALLVGLLFMAGGFMALQQIPDSPCWFAVADLGLAYIPMAWAGARSGRR
jgi:hypothetical protein